MQQEPHVTLNIPRKEHDKILAHLLRAGGCEEAAFVYCSCQHGDHHTRFEFLEWSAVSAEGFVARSPYYLELTDESRASVIKRAHDLGASLAEFHSHRSKYPAAFSSSDFSGFDEFVPHIWWRLKGRPYAAVVVSEASFDAVAWLTDPRLPVALTAIDTGGTLLLPTGLSLGGFKNER